MQRATTVELPDAVLDRAPGSRAVLVSRQQEFGNAICNETHRALAMLPSNAADAYEQLPISKRTVHLLKMR